MNDTQRSGTLFSALHAPHLRRGDTRIIGGVCGFLSRATGLDLTLVRVGILAVGAAAALLGWPFLSLAIGAYGLAWALLPSSNDVILAEDILHGHIRGSYLAVAAMVVVGATGLAGLSRDIALLAFGALAVAAFVAARRGRSRPATPPPAATAATDGPQASPTTAFAPEATGEAGPLPPPPATAAATPTPPTPRPRREPRPKRPGPPRRLSWATAGFALLATAAIFVYAVLSDSPALPLFVVSVFTGVCCAGALIAHVRGRNGGWMSVVGTALVVVLVVPGMLVYNLAPSVDAWSLSRGMGRDDDASEGHTPPHTSTLAGARSLYVDPKATHEYSLDVLMGQAEIVIPKGTPVRVVSELGTGSLLVSTASEVSASGDLSWEGLTPERGTSTPITSRRPGLNPTVDTGNEGWDAKGQGVPHVSVSAVSVPILHSTTRPFSAIFSFANADDAKHPVTVNVTVGIGSLIIYEASEHWDGAQRTSGGSTYFFQYGWCSNTDECFEPPMPGTTTWGNPDQVYSEPTITPTTAAPDGTTTTGPPRPNPFYDKDLFSDPDPAVTGRDEMEEGEGS